MDPLMSGPGIIVCIFTFLFDKFVVDQFDVALGYLFIGVGIFHVSRRET